MRDGDKRIVQIKEGKPEGRHVVIVDDLVQSGGTLLECHNVLAQQGAAHGEHGFGIMSTPSATSAELSCMHELVEAMHVRCPAL